MSLLNEVPLSKLIKFSIFEPLMILYKLLPYPPLRKLFIVIFGGKVGKGTIIHNTSFFNLYRKGFKGMTMGNKCFIGNECMFDLADKITLEDNVTIAERVIILTHMNVGYKDHPLQKHFSKFSKPVIIKEGSFIGAGTIILPGISIGKKSLVAAGSLVNRDVGDNSLFAGNPAKFIREL